MDAPAAQSAGLIKLLAWFEVNKKRVLIGAAVALVVGGGIFLAVNYQSQREVRASEAVSEVKLPLNPMTPAPPGTADAFLKVARDYKGTQAGGRALILAGTTLFVQNQYDDAQKAFDEFVREYPASPFVAEAVFGVASCLDAKKKTAEATAKFEELRRRYGKSAIIDETKLALARLYEEQSRPKDALDLYDELVKGAQMMGGAQMSGLASEAGLRMEDLLAKHPELKKTNPPPIVATPPTPITFPNTNLQVRMMTNRPSMTNLVRMTSNVPKITMTNVVPRTTGAAPSITITTNK